MHGALTIKQPWATLVAEGKKDVENRGWATRWRGLLLIHAGLAFDLEGYESLKSARKIQRTPEKFPTGFIVGAAVLRDCIPWRLANFDPNAYGLDEGPSEWHQQNQIGWYLDAPRLFSNPFPYGGHQGVWFTPEDLELWKAPEPEDPDSTSEIRTVRAVDGHSLDAAGWERVTTLVDELGELGGPEYAGGPRKL